MALLTAEGTEKLRGVVVAPTHLLVSVRVCILISLKGRRDEGIFSGTVFEDNVGIALPGAVEMVCREEEEEGDGAIVSCTSRVSVRVKSCACD